MTFVFSAKGHCSRFSCHDSAFLTQFEFYKPAEFHANQVPDTTLLGYVYTGSGMFSSVWDRIHSVYMGPVLTC